MKKTIFAALIAVLALVSCNNGEHFTAKAASEVSIRFTNESATTRTFFDPSSGAESWEKSLGNISVFVFMAADGKLVLRRDMTQAEVSGNQVRFSLPWSASDKLLRFYAVANYTVAGENITETTVKSLLDAEVGAYNGAMAEVFTKSKRAGGFTMSAIEEVQFANAANTVTDVEMTLRRTVAKVAVRVTVDDAFAQRYGGAGIKITDVSVLNSEKTTTIIAPQTPGAGNMDITLSQTPDVNGKSYMNLFYLFENGSRMEDRHVVLKIDALYDTDGNFSTTGDQTEVAYNVKLNRNASGEVKRNTYYRVEATLTGLDGQNIDAKITVADWDGPVNQTEILGN